MTGEIIAISVIALIIGGATAYIVKAKKDGKKCVGCPFSDSCRSRSSCSGRMKNSENDKNRQKDLKDM